MRREENVVMITLDSLRPDHLGLYGYKKKTSPALDQLGSEGVVFTEAISNGSHTAISFPAILTSTYGSMYDGYGYLSKERTPIAEVLSKEGYSTAAFHSNPYLSAAYNYDRGFEVFYDWIRNDFSVSRFKTLDKLVDLARERIEIRNMLLFMLKLYSWIQPYKIPYEKAEVITQKAIGWLRECSDRFFIWIHYMDTHWPWIPPRGYFPNGSVSNEEASRLWWKMLIDSSSLSDEELRKLVGLYDGQIRYLDHTMGTFFDELGKMGLYDNSLVVVTSDHGEEFKEHGDLGHHSLKLYEELLRVPLVMKFSKGLYGGSVVNDLVSLLDVAPTIVDWLGIDRPKKWVGSSLLPTLVDKRRGKMKAVISEGNIKQGHNIVSYRSKRWKFILDERRRKEELYDLQKDPKETKNLAKMMPRKAKELEAKIAEHLNLVSGAVETPVPSPKTEDEKLIRERLKALGYI